MKIFELLKEIDNDLDYHGAKTIKNKIGLLLLNSNFQLLLSHRLRKAMTENNLHALSLVVKHLQNTLLNCHISSEAEIGRNVKFAHAFGVVIGAAKIEDNVTIFQQVTIGSHGAQNKKKEWPTIRKGTTIYSGAQIIGGILVGENSTIGAGTVITKDVPPNSTCVGPNFRILNIKHD